METTCSLFACAFRTVASSGKRWSIVVRLDLPPHCSFDSIPFCSKRSKNLTFTILSVILHRVLVNANGRYFEGFVGSLPGFGIDTIVGSNHSSGKYPCCHILLYITRREFNPTGGRCFNTSLWILSGPGAEFLWLGSFGSTPIL